MSDSNNNCVQVFDCKGQFLSTIRKKGDASEQIKLPCGISISSDQFVYVCEKNVCQCLRQVESL